ncbi:hypothetical protein GCM10027614_00130 [Micromonospora vulcania]
MVQTTWRVAVGDPLSARADRVAGHHHRREAWRVRELSCRPPPQADPALPAAADLDDRLLTDERDQALWRQVQRLPTRCQRLLRVLAQVDRPDYAVVADAMGMPRGSIGPTAAGAWPSCVRSCRPTRSGDAVSPDFGEQPLDGADGALLDHLAAIYGRLDPPPSDLDDRVRFAIALRNVEIEVAWLATEQQPVGAAGPPSEPVPRPSTRRAAPS